jgi:hypothetical protein
MQDVNHLPTLCLPPRTSAPSAVRCLRSITLISNPHRFCSATAWKPSMCYVFLGEPVHLNGDRS